MLLHVIFPMHLKLNTLHTIFNFKVMNIWILGGDNLMTFLNLYHSNEKASAAIETSRNSTTTNDTTIVVTTSANSIENVVTTISSGGGSKIASESIVTAYNVPYLVP